MSTYTPSAEWIRVAVKVLEEIASEVESSKPIDDSSRYRQGIAAGIDRALFRINQRAAEYRNTTESEGK